ncbi:MAG: AbrB/MazE/SpoVT family DNA-binding domain-containing protein [Armatimonadetes bacterium]|nr:AbrB/MazE/SpoVT family DNA-binding domain-containing protein [Armatimonadota bacterium]
MPNVSTIQLGQRGVLTLPKALRDACHLRPGDRLTVIDLGGMLLLRPGESEIDRLADSLGAALREQGETLESVLAALNEQRDAV